MADRKDPLIGYQFALEVQGVITGYFTEVGGIGSEQEIVEHKVTAPDGKDVIMKIPGRSKWGDIKRESDRRVARVSKAGGCLRREFHIQIRSYNSRACFSEGLTKLKSQLTAATCNNGNLIFQIELIQNRHVVLLYGNSV